MECKKCLQICYQLYGELVLVQCVLCDFVDVELDCICVDLCLIYEVLFEFILEYIFEMISKLEYYIGCQLIFDFFDVENEIQ